MKKLLFLLPITLCFSEAWWERFEKKTPKTTEARNSESRNQDHKDYNPRDKEEHTDRENYERKKEDPRYNREEYRRRDGEKYNEYHTEKHSEDYRWREDKDTNNHEKKDIKPKPLTPKEQAQKSMSEITEHINNIEKFIRNLEKSSSTYFEDSLKELKELIPKVKKHLVDIATGLNSDESVILLLNEK